MNNYVPEPVDTTDVELPQELLVLMEALAENVHNVWAKQRMSEGWKHGNERNDEVKTHPSLVPYSELPENEKNYDRITSAETLKFILKSGYKISR